MKTQLAYGRRHLPVELPPDAEELSGAGARPLADPSAAAASALRRPLGTPSLAELAGGRHHACVVVSDITRPVPYGVLLPPLLAELESRVERLTVLVATGTHRATTPAEKEEMLGPDVAARHEVVDHDSRDEAQLVGLPGRTSSGLAPRVNRLYVEADLKVLTGLVEPHFMAGYSGGRKAVFPGLSDLRSIQRFHGPGFLEDPRAASGVLEGNPCHREACEVARLAGADFTVNVAMNVDRRLVGVFAGELDAAFQAAVAKVDATCRAEAEPADVVVTSGGGYPLDATFYQTVKGMVGALAVVRQGGAVLIASACSEGVGNRAYAELMFRYAGRHQQFRRDIQARCEVVQDQWEFEEQCKVLDRVGVEGLVVCTEGIPRATLERLSVTPAAALCDEADVAARLQGALDALLRARPGARVVAIPQGPYVLATRRRR
ncbi:MAG: nickel-dependent lactate racemase [Candidatus Brocadiia bacterium]